MSEARGTVLQARELKAAALGAAIVASYAAATLATGLVDLAQFADLWAFYIQQSFLLWIAIGAGTAMVQMVRGSLKSGRKPFLVTWSKTFVAERWERDRLVSLLWPPLLWATLMTAFNAFKQMVLPTAGFTFDPLLARADHLLFLGHDGWQVTHAIFGSVAATITIDHFYHGWFLPMSVGTVLCAWLPASMYRLRTQYLLSFAMVWIILGSVMAYLLPSAGPCFYNHFVGPHASYAQLMSDLHQAKAGDGSDLTSVKIQAGLLRLFGSDKLAMGGGISAMPSVHNGLAVLFALAAFRLNRWAGWAVSFYAFMIFLGSIHLGWHYAIDGIVAALCTLLIWRVAGQIADRLESPAARQELQPAMA